MSRRLCWLSLSALFAAMVAATAFAQATDPLIGTWQLNVAKSKFTPGPTPKSETRTYATSGAEIKASSTEVGADGKTTSRSWT